jgi:hypothetical protein
MYYILFGLLFGMKSGAESEAFLTDDETNMESFGFHDDRV